MTHGLPVILREVRNVVRAIEEQRQGILCVVNFRDVKRGRRTAAGCQYRRRKDHVSGSCALNELDEVGLTGNRVAESQRHVTGGAAKIDSDAVAAVPVDCLSCACRRQRIGQAATVPRWPCALQVLRGGCAAKADNKVSLLQAIC